MYSKLLLPAFIGVLFLMFVNCTSSGNSNIAGGASDLEISACAIAGKAVDVYGNVLIGARVTLRPSDYLSGDSIAGGSLRKFADAVTDMFGNFRIDSIDTGSYSIEINFNDSIGTMSYVAISQRDRVKSLATINLLPLATISGSIDISKNSIYVNYSYIKIIGLERNVKPDSTGFYSVRVPSGRHHLYFQNDSSELIIHLGPGEPKTVDIRIRDNRKPNDPLTNDSIILRALLDSLDISQSAFDSVSRFDYGKLILLDLSKRGLQRVDMHLIRFPRLRQLYLNDNKLGDTFNLSPDLSRELERLDLKNNNIIKISNNISSLNSLQFLDLSFNRLTTLPPSITSLRLYTFDISYNAIDSTILSIDQINWLNANDPDWSSTQNKTQ
ncbi:MAG: carboxypeptidase regulatory-like domain-containing protein [Fibrobacter sp.]|nr:carboxypeptidase regulatory-like domain-containing protein [Fibrobacter sp.]